MPCDILRRRSKPSEFFPYLHLAVDLLNLRRLELIALSETALQFIDRFELRCIWVSIMENSVEMIPLAFLFKFLIFFARGSRPASRPGVSGTGASRGGASTIVIGGGISILVGVPFAPFVSAGPVASFLGFFFLLGFCCLRFSSCPPPLPGGGAPGTFRCRGAAPGTSRCPFWFWYRPPLAGVWVRDGGLDMPLDGECEIPPSSSRLKMFGVASPRAPGGLYAPAGLVADDEGITSIPFERRKEN